MNCSRCGSESLSIERQIDGFKTCNDCGFKEKNVSQTGHVVYTIHEDRCYKNCMCSVCGKISKCTPSHDFYSTPEHGEELVCESCFNEYLGHKLNAEKFTATMTPDRAKLIKPYGDIPVNTEGDVVHRRPDGGVTVVWDGYNCEHPMRSHEVVVTEKMGIDEVYTEGEA